MRSLFGISQDALIVGVGAAVGTLLVVLVLLAVRQPLFARLAARRAFRRPGLAALITAGLTVGTIVLSSAFTTGDTVSLSVRSVVSGVVGSADELVFLPKRQRRSGAEIAQALASGTYLSGWNEYFPESELDRIRDLTANNPNVAAVTPAVVEHVAISTEDLGFRGQLPILGLPADALSQAGGLWTVDSQPVDLRGLGDGQVLMNTEAAAGLGVAVGDSVRLLGLAHEVDLRVVAITKIGDVGGGQASLFLPLPRLQEITDRPGQINQILIRNRGGAAERIRASWPATVALRSGLLDDRAATRLFQVLSQRSVLDALASESMRGRGSGRADEKLKLLVQSLDSQGPSQEFEALVQDPDLLGRVAASLNVSPGALERSPLFGPGGERRLRVLDVQQMAQDQADRWASAFTSLFVALGLFSLSTGVLLVLLIFSLLALERRGELGTFRALGGRRTDVVAMLVFEGVVHSALASAVGLVLGVGLAMLLLGVAGGLLAQYGFRLEPAIEPASLAVSAAMGFLLTAITVAGAAWRSSRFSIVAAIRDLPDPAIRGTSLLSVFPGSVSTTAGLLLGWTGYVRGWPLSYVVGVVLAVVGVALLVRFVLLRWLAGRGERALWTLTGLLLVLFAAAPTEALRLLGISRIQTSVELSVWRGLCAVLGGVSILAMNAGMARLAARRLMALRLGAAELAAHRFRTGMTLAMFALVVLSLTVAGVLLTVTHVAFGDPEVTSGGWHLRGESDGPRKDVLSPLTEGPVDAGWFRGTGAAATIPVEAIQIGDAGSRWGTASLTVVDSAFTETVTSSARANSDDSRALWRQLAETPRTALVGEGLLTSSPVSGDARFAASHGSGFKPFIVWVRDSRGLQPAVRLEVIGIVDGRGPYSKSIVVGQDTLSGWPPADRFTYLFAMNEPTYARDAALAVSMVMPELNVQVIGDDLRLMQGVRGLLATVLQGYMAIGLISGLAALGLISARAVVERRRQLGTLRALGASGGSITRMLLMEAGLVAGAGALLGVATGLLVANQIVSVLVRQTPELRFTVPWEQLAVLIGVVLVTGLLTTIVPALQAGRLAPAEALREA
jgi:putative ABC transport system permease protein